MKDYLERMRVPPKFWDSQLEKISAQPKVIIDRFLSDFNAYLSRGWGLLFWGDYGTGKTAAASVMMKEGVIKNYKTGLWVFADDVASFIIDKTQFDSTESMQERMLSVDLLLIDEFLISSKRDSFKDTSLEMIFRRRVAMKKSTCFTTNLTPKMIEERYPALFNVMLECVFPVKFSEQFRKGISDDIREDLQNGK